MINKKNKYIFSFIILLSILTLFIINCKKSHYKLSRFISPETCGGCHVDIYNQWKNSMHHLAHVDPIYHEVAQFLRKGLTNKDEIKEADLCVKCHTPVGFITGFPKKTSDDISKTPELASQGIQCDYCHSAIDAKKLFNNGLVIEPGHGDMNPGVKRGPFKDSKSDYHGSAYSQLHTQSQICGTCHDVRHVAYGTKLETTYEEWLSSPYNSKDPNKAVPCQGCHMYQRPGVPATGSTARPKNPGKASSDGPKRDHIFTHYFVGANSYIPGQYKDKEKEKMAIDRLKHAAELEIIDTNSKDGEISVRVKNTGAGHKLPTGLTDVRQMWLEITIKNKNKEIYSSGKVDKNGYITKNTIIYNTVFGDGNGKVVSNISKAKEILKDRRIPPGSYLDEKIKLPKFKNQTIAIEVKLLYRSAPQKVLDMVLGKGKVTLPILQMEKIKKTIKI